MILLLTAGMVTWDITQAKRKLKLITDQDGNLLKRRALKLSLLVGAICMILLSLARPQSGLQAKIVELPAAELILALDVSTSMSARDVHPDRFSRAKDEVGYILERLSGDRAGVVIFARKALTICPVTGDLEAVEATIESAYLNMIPYPGTRISLAVEEAIRSFSQDRDIPKILVLITDGESHEEMEEMLKAADKAWRRGIRIFCLGIGTVQGAILPEKDVVSRLNPRALEGISRTTGGKWSVKAEDIWPDIASIERGRVKRRFTRYSERFQYPALIALILLALEVAL
jgi:Ca-activated chloride channel family protein